MIVLQTKKLALPLSTLHLSSLMLMNGFVEHDYLSTDQDAKAPDKARNDRLNFSLVLMLRLRKLVASIDVALRMLLSSCGILVFLGFHAMIIRRKEYK